MKNESNKTHFNFPPYFSETISKYPKVDHQQQKVQFQQMQAVPLVKNNSKWITLFYFWFGTTTVECYY